MIGVDTNVLVRYIVQDDRAQAKKATTYLERHCRADDPGRIACIVLCELVWVLDGAYGYNREQVAGQLHGILNAVEFDVEQSHVARLALLDYESGRADYADYLIARLNAEAGVEHTVTFDKKAGRHTLYKLLR